MEGEVVVKLRLTELGVGLGGSSAITDSGEPGRDDRRASTTDE